jgi:hypothetical protein
MWRMLGIMLTTLWVSTFPYILEMLKEHIFVLWSIPILYKTAVRCMKSVYSLDIWEMYNQETRLMVVILVMSPTGHSALWESQWKLTKCLAVPSCFLHKPKLSICRLLCLLPASCWLILWPWWQKWHVCLKHQLMFNRLHGINIPADRSLHYHHCEKLKSYKV